MRDRAGVLLLFFDFPMTTKQERKKYTAFRKYLKRSGFLPLQESVYVKYLRNASSASREIEKIGQYATEENRISVLALKIAEYLKMESFGSPPLDLSLFCDDVVAI